MQSNALEPEPPILTVEEAAAFLRLSERKLYSLVQERRVPFARIDGRLLFARHLLMAWVVAQAEGPQLKAPPPVLAGSHDPLLEWAARESGAGLALLTEGSGDGLRRLAGREALAAGIHLRESDGSYNVAAVRALGEPDLVLIGWAIRQQGLVLHPRHEAITGLADAVRHGLRLGRRQPGAGAQVLALQLLAQAGIALEATRWSERVYRTHDDLAAAILESAVDAGIAVGAVARRYRLPFRPLVSEQFDLVMRRRDYFDPPIQALFAFTRSPLFGEHAHALGGYDVTCSGEVRFNA